MDPVRRWISGTADGSGRKNRSNRAHPPVERSLPITPPSGLTARQMVLLNDLDYRISWPDYEIARRSCWTVLRAHPVTRSSILTCGVVRARADLHKLEW